MKANPSTPPPLAKTLAAGDLLESLDRLDTATLRAWINQLQEAEITARAVFAAKRRRENRLQRKAVRHA
jgi:hypothetical protein